MEALLLFGAYYMIGEIVNSRTSGHKMATETKTQMLLEAQMIATLKEEGEGGYANTAERTKRLTTYMEVARELARARLGGMKDLTDDELQPQMAEMMGDQLEEIGDAILGTNDEQYVKLVNAMREQNRQLVKANANMDKDDTVDRRRLMRKAKDDTEQEKPDGTFELSQGQLGYIDVLASEKEFALNVNQVVGDDITGGEFEGKFTMASDQPDVNAQEAAQRLVQNEFIESQGQVTHTDTGFASSTNGYANLDVNASDSLSRMFVQSIDESDTMNTGARDTIHGSLYNLNPDGIGVQDTLSSHADNFYMQKREVGSSQHFVNDGVLVGVGAQDLRQLHQEVTQSTFQNLRHDKEAPLFYNVENMTYDTAFQPSRDASILTRSDRFIRPPEDTHANVDSLGQPKPIIQDAMHGRADRVPVVMHQANNGQATQLPKRIEYNESVQQRQVPHDSYQSGPQQHPIVLPDVKMNANIEYYAGQQTNMIAEAPFEHTGGVLFDQPKKAPDYDASTWATGERVQDPHVHATQGVRSTLRDEYIEYSRQAGALMHNNANGRTMQSAASSRGMRGDQNARESYMDNTREPAGGASEYTPQMGQNLTELASQLPARQMPDIEQDVSDVFISPLAYNPYVP
jgi:hypothetical protein